jgi:hypothetical protein
LGRRPGYRCALDFAWSRIAGYCFLMARLRRIAAVGLKEDFYSRFAADRSSLRMTPDWEEGP